MYHCAAHKLTHPLQVVSPYCSHILSHNILYNKIYDLQCFLLFLTYNFIMLFHAGNSSSSVLIGGVVCDVSVFSLFNFLTCLNHLPPSAITQPCSTSFSLTDERIRAYMASPHHNQTSFRLYSMAISRANSTAWEMVIITDRNRNINLLLMKMSISGLLC